jgi:hypothetical protein
MICQQQGSLNITVRKNIPLQQCIGLAAFERHEKISFGNMDPSAMRLELDQVELVMEEQPCNNYFHMTCLKDSCGSPRDGGLAFANRLYIHHQGSQTKRTQATDRRVDNIAHRLCSSCLPDDVALMNEQMGGKNCRSASSNGPSHHSLRLIIGELQLHMQTKKHML